jgi:Terminase large subunit, T4likevirus-type, N-terminal
VISDAISRDEAVAELWRRGRLRWKLYPDQREVYDSIRAFLDNPETRFEDFWFDISRQWGKTYLGLLISTEEALRHDGWAIGYTASTRSDLWQFVQPNMDVLLADCPDDLRPRWNSQTNDWEFQNGTIIHLAGVNNGHENDARGPRRHLMVNEECAFVDRYGYLHDSVEVPMLTTTGGRILNITTPAETPAHESHSYMLKCRQRGNYIRRTLDDNHHLSQAAKEKLLTEVGGRDTTTARREFFCEWITDETRAIVPEYTEALDADLSASEPPPPTHEQPTIAMDVGFEDFHHVLFGCTNCQRSDRVEAV